uniref:Secreted protein n=1 Tax=Heterorhabditis bacteriophora TaxID=37862 RepID=A0A1I7W6Y3_HETBA
MLQNLGKTDLCPIFYLCVSYLSTAKCEPAEVSSGFKSPSKATRNEWLDTTRTTFRIWKLFGWQLLNSYPSDEFGKRKEKEMKDAFWFLNGTDPTLQIPLRMTYTTRPSQDLSDQ